MLSGLPSAGSLTITGLPVAVGSYYGALSAFVTTLQAAVTSPVGAEVDASTSAIRLHSYATGAYTPLLVSQCTTTTQFTISGFYHT